MALLFYTMDQSCLVPVSSASGNNEYVVNVLARLQGDNTDGQVSSSILNELLLWYNISIRKPVHDSLIFIYLLFRMEYEPSLRFHSSYRFWKFHKQNCAKFL